ncbi:SPFH domain-containing protein [Acetivibrio mesophilus]|uniref:Virion core protein (Lumpy skin disease virus) n=1 Tax=Acetivibrio mesophilus TaxID=2487273 RepID=A0A4Q0I2S8_9FIRM|nr:SPFH domain-containing protein [Acetivibrio mesophilus]ODM26543.1 virion core protein (lumpy skin disease virus) [Clostridium sp. Bc-iso-3]RXE58533.1 virion core protein (lumpy skin disease virus) [Acetivibrio mesophilus]HHV30629.1 virion core protein (lumpy skin disease virus) [Clostridium sp.]
MGLMNFIKGQFIEVIEWTDSSADTIVYRFPVANKEIKMGAQLTVRESQAAVFINEGQLADVFEPGRYELTTENMPLLTKLKSWKYGFNSPFKAEVYFINTRLFTEQTWGTQSPLPVLDPMFGPIEVGARGTYSFRVSDPAKFLRDVSGTRGTMATQDLTKTLRSYIMTYLKDSVAESKKSFFEMQSNMIEFGEMVRVSARGKFEALGLELAELTVESLILPEELRKAYQEGAQINLMGGMDTYAKKRTLDAMNTAAGNQGGGGFAGMGAGMGAGAAIGNMMGQMFTGGANQQSPQYYQPQQQAQPQPQQEGVVCSACNAKAALGTKFCPNCGKSLVEEKVKCIKCNHEIAKGIKFCPNCGEKQEQQDKACGGCGTKLSPGTKFCSQCGTKAE